MAGSGTSFANAGTYKFGVAAGSINREDILPLLTNVSPRDTPWLSQAPRSAARHTTHDWIEDSLTTVTASAMAAVDGADYVYDASTTPSRRTNVTEIFRKDIGTTLTQQALNPAGFKDAYALEMFKAFAEINIAIEKTVFSSQSSSSGSSTSARMMSPIEGLATTNVFTSTNYGAATATSHSSILDFAGFNGMMRTIYVAGGNPELCFASPAVKPQISALNVMSSLAINVRNISAVDKELTYPVNYIETEFGILSVILDRHVPEATSTTSATGQTDVTGRIFFMQRDKVRPAWLPGRELQHRMLGLQGDSVKGICLTELTLEVLSGKCVGIIKGVNNKWASG